MKVEILFPSVANLYGETVEVQYLKKCLPDAEFISTEINDTPAFASEEVDMIFMATMTESMQEVVAEKLKPYKERIESLIENGTVFLIIGNALEIFGEYIENEDGSKIDCLGLFPTYAKRKMLARYNSLFLGSLGDIKIVGFKAQFSHSYGDNSNGYLFDVIKGAGLKPESKFEGLRRNNFLASYVLGPVLIQNPLYTKYILSLLGIENPVIPFEETATKAYNKRLEEFENPAVRL